jgi:pimeloyl-ACP methyl ester carboxylesterase
MGIVNIYRSIAKLENIDIFYQDTKTEGQAILCLHGKWGRGETWVDFMQHYGEKYRVIAPDLRGHGLSGKPISKYTAKEMADDMVALLNFLNLDSVIVVGHSMGGHVAGYLTARYTSRVKALAILDKSAAGPDKLNPLPLNKIVPIDLLTKDWPLPFASRIEAQEFLKKEMESELSYNYFMNSLVETVAGYQMMFSSQAMAAHKEYYETWFHLLPELKCSVLLVRTKNGEAVSDEDFLKMQSLIGDCMACEMSHPDHNVHLGNKEEFYRYFDEFLKKIG